jgi:hypothetical protein
MSLSARRHAFAPSITNNSVRSVGSPRSIRSASSALHAAGFSGAPSRSPQHVLVTPAVDADRGQHHVLGEAHPVAHHRDQVQPAASALHQRRGLRAVPSTNRSLTTLLPLPCTFCPLGSVSSEGA